MSDGTQVGTDAGSPLVGMSLAEVGQSVIDAPDAAPAEETPADAAPLTGVSAEVPAPEAEAVAEPVAEVDADAEPVIPDPLEGIDRETLEPAQQAAYDDLAARYKSMQADATRKWTAAADLKREATASIGERTALEAKVAEMEARLGALNPPAQEAGVDTEALLWTGLGEPITEQAALEDATGKTLFAFNRQIAVVEARRAARDAFGIMAPQVENVAGQLTAAQQAAYAGEVTTFMGANPDVEPYRDQMAGLLESGVAKTLDEAAEWVRGRFTTDERVAQALQLGQAAGEQKAKAVGANQAAFSVPAGSTPAPEGGNIYAGKTLDEVREMKVKELG